MNNQLKKPFVSIIIPTFNRSHIVNRAIQSVFGQTYDNWEIVLVDDGSEDLTVEMLKKIYKNEPRIKIIAAAHQGLASTRNLGVSNSNGEIIAFLDSDDEFSPFHLELHCEILKRHTNLGLLMSSVEVIGSELVPNKNNPKEMISLKDCFICGSSFFRKNVILSLGGFPQTNFSEDSQLFANALKAGIKHYKTPFKTYRYYRDQNDSICNQLTEEACSP
jgi:glycosyltransferase involved in cell wall biosynthesis